MTTTTTPRTKTTRGKKQQEPTKLHEILSNTANKINLMFTSFAPNSTREIIERGRNTQRRKKVYRRERVSFPLVPSSAHRTQNIRIMYESTSDAKSGIRGEKKKRKKVRQHVKATRRMKTGRQNMAWKFVEKLFARTTRTNMQQSFHHFYLVSFSPSAPFLSSRSTL